jgi:Zn-dependent protease with chaperone function
MPAGSEFDFWRQQALARRDSRRLIAAYALAVAFVVACFCAVVALLYAFLAAYTGGGIPLAGDAPLEWRGLFGTYFQALARVPARVYLITAAVVGGTVIAVSFRRMMQLREGGDAIADLLGARLIEPGRCTLPERQLLNVVEEMAIASGIAVPPVYLIDDDRSINALVAGHSSSEAVIIVTRGAVVQLSRDELQGVMGHEYSHILNGDMALNLRVVGVLAGLRFIEESGIALVNAAASATHRVSREKRGGEAVFALFGLAIAFIGFPGVYAAEAIRAALSRQREFLADAASVQFTRNPAGIAGALDTILATKFGTHVRGAHVGALSHMFFAQAVAHWWGFPTHPPIADRIRRAHPRFQRDDYRRTRRPRPQDEVAVIDGSGNVVKTIRGSDSAAPSAPSLSQDRLDAAAKLIGAIPLVARERMRSTHGALRVLFALALQRRSGGVSEAPLRALEERRGAEFRAQAEAMGRELQGLGRAWTLPLVELTLPLVRTLPQAERDALLADFRTVIEADQHVTLSRFVLLTYLRQHLREGAGRPIRSEFRNVDAVAAEAHAVLSLIAHASGKDAAQAFEKGLPILASGAVAALGQPLAPAALSTARIETALERLRLLAPLAKPRIVKACLDAASADGVFRVPEVELVRMVAATLDCPLPPTIAAMDPATLPA